MTKRQRKGNKKKKKKLEMEQQNHPKSLEEYDEPIIVKSIPFDMDEQMVKELLLAVNPKNKNKKLAQVRLFFREIGVNEAGETSKKNSGCNDTQQMDK